MFNVYYTIDKMDEIILQAKMVQEKMGPHHEHVPARTDLEIVEQVLKDSSSSSTFLSNIGVSSVRSTSTISATRIRELEEKLQDQEQQSEQSAERYKQDMEAKLQAQAEKYEQVTRRQQELIEAIQKSHEEKSVEMEKRQKEMDAMIGFMLRNSQSS
jgi:DNA anti-recombination protein RmuC